jgi:hypothetical protein
MKTDLGGFTRMERMSAESVPAAFCRAYGTGDFWTATPDSARNKRSLHPGLTSFAPPGLFDRGLVASRILPWGKFTAERLNPKNGLGLAAHF